MTNIEILTRAIQRAIGGGFVPVDVPNFEPTRLKIKMPSRGDLGWPWYLVRWTDSDTGVDTEVNIEHVVFGHSFAKALWPGEAGYSDGVGTELPVSVGGYPSESPSFEGEPLWKLHLANMVVADDPIAYLGEHLNGD